MPLFDADPLGSLVAACKESLERVSGLWLDQPATRSFLY
jgi:hypothetical protein